MTQARNLSRLLNKDITTYMYTATAGQTAFTGSDDNSQTLTFDNQSIMVTYNGVMLEKGSEFTVAANTVTLLAGAEVNAEVNVIVFNNASLGGYVKSTGGDIDGGVNITSGNLLVGKSVDTLATSGTVLFANGQVDASVDSNYVAKFNRKSSDGTILELRKDTTNIVGSIGVTASDILYLANPDGTGCGLNFDGDNPKINPTNGSGAGTNGIVDLGWSGGRFKDLYLSGGIQFDSRTNKLDDYEEGTWTPAPTVGTASSASGTYTKIGRMVVVTGFVSGMNTVNNETLIIQSLPFTGGNIVQCVGQAMWSNVDKDFGYEQVFYSGSSQFVFYHSTNGSYDAIRHIDLDGSNSACYFSATYLV